MQINVMNMCEWQQVERARRKRVAREAFIVNSIGIIALVAALVTMVLSWWLSPRDEVAAYYGGDAAARRIADGMTRAQCVAFMDRICEDR